jgi:chaperonin GroES
MPKKENKITGLPFKTKNLVEHVEKEELRKIGDQVVMDYDRDYKSSEQWREQRARWLKLFMQHVDPKNFPWENAANIPVPTLTTAIVQFQARAYEALMPAKDKIRIDYTGSEDVKRAERVQKHMNYQLNYDMEDYEEDWDISLFQLAVNGSIFRKVYYDPIKEKNVAEYCDTERITVPYSRMPNKTPDRITDRLFLTVSDIKLRQNAGIFDKNFEATKGSRAEIDTTSGQVKETNDNIEKVVDSTEDAGGNEKSNSGYPRVFLEQHRLWDLDGDGIAEPYVITVDKETRDVVRITKRTYKDGQGTEYVVDYFEHYYFLPNPEGYYGLGFGHMLGGINESIKSILDQVIDGGTMHNLSGKTGFVNGRRGLKKGKIKFNLGHYEVVDVDTDDIRKSIMPFTFDGPSTVLFSTLGLLQDYADRVSTVSELQTGELPKSDTPATAIVAAIEQGMKVFSSIHKRIHRTLKKEFRKLYRLNGIYAENEKYLKILGEAYVAKYIQQQIPIDMAGDYLGDIDLQPVSDPRIVSRTEKVALAEQVLARVMENPATQNDPRARTEAYRYWYEAMEIPEYERFLEQPPQPPPDLPQPQENAMMMNEQEIHALPQQNHMEHIGIMDEIMKSTFAEEFTPRGKRLMEIHRREHTAFLYLQSVQGEEMEQQQGLGQGPIPGGQI